MALHRATIPVASDEKRDTNLSEVKINLAAAGGGRDGQADTIIVNATNGDDVIVISGDNGVVMAGPRKFAKSGRAGHLECTCEVSAGAATASMFERLEQRRRIARSHRLDRAPAQREYEEATIRARRWPATELISATPLEPALVHAASIPRISGIAIT